MNTKQFQYVIELSREQNFTYAAENLSITQSSLSQYIKKVESGLGTALFIRDGNQVQLTPAGETYLTTAKRILDLERRLQNDIREIAGNMRGVITVGVSPYICSSTMPFVLSEFHTYYPNIEVRLIEKVTVALIEGISCSEFDLCVTTLPEDASEYDYRSLPAEEIVVAVPKVLGSIKATVHEGKMFPVVDFRQMRGMPFITQRSSQVFGQMLEKLCRISEIDVKRVIECVNVEAIHSMVYKGLGCALLPCNQVIKDTRSVYAEKIDYFSLSQDVSWRTAVFWRKAISLTQPMKEMVSMLQA